MLPNPLVVSIDIRRTERGQFVIVVVSHDEEGMPVERSSRTVARFNIAVAQASIMVIEMMATGAVVMMARKKSTRPAGD